MLRRNLRVYWRDHLGVLFSLLAPMILLVVMLFLAKLQIDNLSTQFIHPDREKIKAFIAAWTASGIISLATFSTAVASMSLYINDRVGKRFALFATWPIARFELVISYLLSAAINALLTATLIICLTAAVMRGIFGTALAFSSYFLAWLGAGLSSIFFSALMAAVVSVISSHSAFTALSATSSALVGFVMGAYLPVGLLGEMVVKVMNLLPFAPATMLIRSALCTQLVSQLAEGHQTAADTLNMFYGIQLSVGSFSLTPALIIAGLVAGSVLAVICASWQINRALKIT